MKWFAISAALLFVFSASTAEADLFSRLGAVVSGGPVQVDGKGIDGPIQADGKHYGQVPGDCGCYGKGAGHAGLGNGRRPGFIGACCGKSSSSSCCDHVWDGYCHNRKRHCYKKASGDCCGTCASNRAPRFSMPKIHLPKVHVDWSHCGIKSGRCPTSWRHRGVPVVHHRRHLFKRGHGHCSSCDAGDGKAYYKDKVPAAPMLDGSIDASSIPTPQLDLEETSEPVRSENATADDNSAWLPSIMPGLFAR